MGGNPRVVFDTNAIVSALLFHERSPRQALQQALTRGEWLLNPDVTEELAAVLRREKFDRYVTRKLREDFLRILIQKAVFVEITESIQACRDPKDDKFLELAVSGKASHVISGDDDLLALNPFRDISILTPTQFLEFLINSQ